jgi:hypothetical protein
MHRRFWRYFVCDFYIRLLYKCCKLWFFTAGHTLTNGPLLRHCDTVCFTFYLTPISVLTLYVVVISHKLIYFYTLNNGTRLKYCERIVKPLLFVYQYIALHVYIMHFQDNILCILLMKWFLKKMTFLGASMAKWLWSFTSNHLPLTAVSSNLDFGFFYVRKLSS